VHGLAGSPLEGCGLLPDLALGLKLRRVRLPVLPLDGTASPPLDQQPEQPVAFVPRPPEGIGRGEE